MPPAARLGDMTSHGTPLTPLSPTGGQPERADRQAAGVAGHGRRARLPAVVGAGGARGRRGRHRQPDRLHQRDARGAREGDVIVESGRATEQDHEGLPHRARSEADAHGRQRGLIPPRAFLGVGWAFPPRLRPDGRIAEAVYEEDVREAIRIVLGTNPGERVMRPDFGAGLRTFVFEPVNPTMLARVEARVRDALVTWEPRIDVDAVRVSRAGEPPSTC